jgi:TrwC relaxase
VVANTVTLPDGTRRALDARGLYQHAQAASALATAEMRHQLTTRLGVRWRPGHKGGWEIAGISDRVLSEFSQRRNEIDDTVRELEEAIGRGAHPGEVENIVLRTRPAKNDAPAADLVDGWRARAAAQGLDADALAACHGHPTPVAEPDTEKLFASVAGPDGICAGGSVFSRADALVALANQPIPTADGKSQPLLTAPPASKPSPTSSSPQPTSCESRDLTTGCSRPSRCSASKIGSCPGSAADSTAGPASSPTPSSP